MKSRIINTYIDVDLLLHLDHVTKPITTAIETGHSCEIHLFYMFNTPLKLFYCEFIGTYIFRRVQGLKIKDFHKIHIMLRFISCILM